MNDASEVRSFLRDFAQNLIDQHPLGQHKDGSTRYLIKCPSQVLGESILSALPQSKTDDDKLLAHVLRKFISWNLNDHGFVELQANEVVLDGRVGVTEEEAAALTRAGLVLYFPN